MISADDIEAFREDADTWDRVTKRWLNGTTKHREMTASETPAYMRHSLRMDWALRKTLAENEALRAELAARNAVAMSPGEPEPKYGAV
jgi:hypothetical protein